MKRDEAQLDNPDRRRFILASSAAIGVHALPGGARAQRARKPHVIVIGAGLAGLCAAFKLQEAGFTYRLLEAEPRHVGGRVRTLGFRSGQWWDAGAMRIPLVHTGVLDYVKALGLQCRPFVMYSSRTFYYARNTRANATEPIKPLYGLSDEEAKTNLWLEAVAKVAKGHDGVFRLDKAELHQLVNGDRFQTKKLIDLDGRSLRQLLEAARLPSGAALSGNAVDFALFASGNTAIQHGAATEFLREENLGVWDKFVELVDGTSALPKALHARLHRPARMGCEVVRIVQDRSRGRVRAIYKTAGGLRSEEADFLICAIPLPALARVDIDPPLSYDKQRAVREVAYDSGTKVALLTRNRFWEKNNGIYGGTSTTDLPTGSIVYPSDNALDEDGDKPCDKAVSDAPGVLVAAYAWGQDARRLGAMRHEERARFVVKQVSKVHPELCERGMVRDAASFAWDNHRWSGGAFAWYQPGQFTQFHEHVLRAEDRIHFAGEHCSRSHTWMEGAVESAERAVNELLRRA